MPLSAFHPAVRQWFHASLGEPTRAQALAWPAIGRGESTLVLAPTGSGKTLAAFLSAIDRAARAPEPPPDERLRVLYVSPLKALAVDIEKNLRAPLAGIAQAAAELGAPVRRLEVAVRTGDTPAADRARMLRASPDLLITTPESLYLMLTSRQRARLAHVDTVIVDEIHQLAASKRGAHLFLSLERLEALVRARSPKATIQRIGLSATQRPLETVARLLGGFEARGRRREPAPRPVTIVDASAGGPARALSIKVEVPPPLAEARALEDDPPGRELGSVWPSVHAHLVERVREARSTMIFVNSRRLAERLAAALNEVAGEEIALAHHGSIAKDKRRVIEERLKAGLLPAIVATSSLELGIDMGAVDQVIQIEAPPSVAAGIQRIGRASHHVGGVPTGVLVPKHKHDLLACAAAASGIESGDVEETRYPKNPLDVLAQQIVAVTAVGLGLPDGKDTTEIETRVDAVWELVRRAAPFAELPRASFEGVLDMLSGRYPSDELAGLRPRVTWDRRRGVLTPRAGAKRLAILNAGTIPDRGLYGVFLAGGEPGATRVGELDEEMVYELREGEVFLLGASSWRADEITQDRVLVTPAAGEPGKMPFWHGDRLGRSRAFGARIGALAREIASRPRDEGVRLLRERHHVDARAASDLADYIGAQREALGAVPSDRTIVVERVTDELGDLRICLMTPFGTRVHAPWAMAALAKLRAARGGDVQAVWSDDGVVFRVPGGDEPPALDLLLPSADEVDDLVARELAGSSLFAARFREAAARALLLPRRAVGQRTPLWAQRKRAADLLSVAREYPSFPIVLETYRECLRDTFDLSGLAEVLRAVESRAIRVVAMDTPAASPFAASLLFSFVGSFIYDPDAPPAERRAHALTVDHAQLRELLGDAELRSLLDPEVVDEHARALGRLDAPLRHADALHDLLLWVGDQSPDEIARRTASPEIAAELASALERAQRIVRVSVGGHERLVAVEDAARYRDALGLTLPPGLPSAFTGPTRDALEGLVARYARTHGPFSASEVAARWGLGIAPVEAALARLVAEGKVIAGAFRCAGRRADRAGPEARGSGVEHCHAEVLRALKRKTLARLRQTIAPVTEPAFARFLLDWQGVEPGREGLVSPAADAETSLLHAIGQLEGYPVAASALEAEILPARVPGYRPHHLDSLLACGEVVWAGVAPIGDRDGRVALYRADREPLLARQSDPSGRPEGPLFTALRDLFARRGAVFFAEMRRETGAYPAELSAALWELVWAGEVTNDTLEPLRSLLAPEGRTRGRPRLAARSAPPGTEGRWSLRRARWGAPPTDTERAAAIARALLERYGVVVRDAAAAEGLAGGFGGVYDVLRALEEQGRVRRGYFVGGRGAAQFALAGADERLRRRLEAGERDRAVVLAAVDPASPYGALVPWPKAEGGGARPQRAPGARVVLLAGKLVAWMGRGGQSLLTFLAEDEPSRAREARAVARALVDVSRRERRPLIVATIDGAPAPESALAPALRAEGFAARRGALVRLVERRGELGGLSEERERGEKSVSEERRA